MAERVANVAVLGWPIDLVNRQVFVYCPGLDAERLGEPASPSGYPPSVGFTLGMSDIW